MSATVYNCAQCGNEREISESGDNIPECCGKAMLAAEPLPVCSAPASAEHSRMDDLGEPGLPSAVADAHRLGRLLARRLEADSAEAGAGSGAGCFKREQP